MTTLFGAYVARRIMGLLALTGMTSAQLIPSNLQPVLTRLGKNVSLADCRTIKLCRHDVKCISRGSFLFLSASHASALGQGIKHLAEWGLYFIVRGSCVFASRRHTRALIDCRTLFSRRAAGLDQIFYWRSFRVYFMWRAESGFIMPALWFPRHNWAHFHPREW